MNSDGSVSPKTPASINEAANQDRLKGKWQITTVRAPALFILAHNHLTDFLTGTNVDQDIIGEVMRATAETDLADTERTNKLRHDSPGATFVELDHTDHHCFIQRRDQVLGAMQRFLP